MTIEELAIIGSAKVRRDSNLMSVYKLLFKEKFGREPDCAGCTFNSDWIRLTQSGDNNNFNNTTMANITFKLFDNSEIYTFYRENKATKTKVPVRTYGYNMSEEFANEFLTTGDAEEIEKRKAFFKVLPAAVVENAEVKKEVKTTKVTK